MVTTTNMHAASRAHAASSSASSAPAASAAREDTSYFADFGSGTSRALDENAAPSRRYFAVDRTRRDFMDG